MTKTEAQQKIDSFTDGNDVQHPVLHKAMSFFFDMIKSMEHWKAPIDCWVKREDYYYIATAIAFFTGTETQIVESLDDGSQYHIESPGYWGGPCC